MWSYLLVIHDVLLMFWDYMKVRLKKSPVSFQASSQLPQTAATCWPRFWRRSAVKRSRLFSLCRTAASRSWTLLAFCLKLQHPPHNATAAAPFHSAWFCLWGGVTGSESSWPPESSPSRRHQRSCRLSAPFSFTPPNGSFFNPRFILKERTDVIFKIWGKRKTRECIL